MTSEAADGQSIQEDVVDVAILSDPGMANFDVAAAEAAFPSESIGGVRWWFLGHGGYLPRLWMWRKMVVVPN